MLFWQSRHSFKKKKKKANAVVVALAATANATAPLENIYWSGLIGALSVSELHQDHVTHSISTWMQTFSFKLTWSSLS